MEGIKHQIQRQMNTSNDYSHLSFAQYKENAFLHIYCPTCKTAPAVRDWHAAKIGDVHAVFSVCPLCDKVVRATEGELHTINGALNVPYFDVRTGAALALTELQ